VERNNFCPWPDLRKNMGSFLLEVKEGHFSDSEIIVMLGQNGTGKTTFIRMLAGFLMPDPPADYKGNKEDYDAGMPKL